MDIPAERRAVFASIYFGPHRCCAITQTCLAWNAVTTDLMKEHVHEAFFCYTAHTQSNLAHNTRQFTRMQRPCRVPVSSTIRSAQAELAQVIGLALLGHQRLAGWHHLNNGVRSGGWNEPGGSFFASKIGTRDRPADGGSRE